MRQASLIHWRVRHTCPNYLKKKHFSKIKLSLIWSNNIKKKLIAKKKKKTLTLILMFFTFKDAFVISICYIYIYCHILSFPLAQSIKTKVNFVKTQNFSLKPVLNFLLSRVFFLFTVYLKWKKNIYSRIIC